MNDVAAKRLILVLALIVASRAAYGQQTVRQWEVFEIEMTAEAELGNPYVEGLPDGGAPYTEVTFTGRDGDAEGRSYRIAAFWDGGRAWTVRFAPPLSGEWSYQTSSRDSGLNGKTGTFRCISWTEAEKSENPVRRGFVRVARKGERAGRYFVYADGTPFLWIGDTWWNWTKKGIHLSSFQKLADDRARKGFTVGQMFFAGNHGLLAEGYNSPELDQIHNVEQMIRYANSRGITVWIHAWWSREDIDKTIGAEKMRRWWRYVIHRLSAFNVIWVLAGEYNMHNYGGLGLRFWKDLGAMIDREDPYERIIGAHPTPPAWSGGAGAPQWSTGEVLHDEPWLDYNQSQVGHGKWRNEMIPLVVAADYARRPPKPVVVTEPWYEFVEGSSSAMDVRFGAWSAILSGAAGHTYGGGHVWWAHVPEAPAQVGNWPLEEGFERDTLDYAGAKSMAFLARFLKGIEWWKLEPHPELVLEYPAKFCAAVPGNEYVAYLRWGGAVKLDLRSSRAEDLFEYKWIDLADMGEPPGGTVAGGGVRQFHTPEDYPRERLYKDWVLHVKKRR